MNRMMMTDCDKDPRGCWNVRCQLGKKCVNGLDEPKACQIAHSIGVMVGKTSAAIDGPAWHESPTASGLWVCVDKLNGALTYTVTPDSLTRLHNAGDRWFGPIPSENQ